LLYHSGKQGGLVHLQCRESVKAKLLLRRHKHCALSSIENSKAESMMKCEHM
jgi:hypothetical protein